MKRLFILTGLFFALTLAVPNPSFAQGMMENNMMGRNGSPVQGDDDHTASEEARGKEIWEKLQAKEVTCEKLTDDNFESLGEYFMGQMAGDRHAAMNQMLIQMSGEDGEEQMHIVMGKRMSNCEPDAPMPQAMNDSDMMSMMRMMMGGGMMGRGTMGGNNPMMESFATSSISWISLSFGVIFLILLLSFLVLADIALIKWIMAPDKRDTIVKPTLDVLKERYAKGEIDKKEFEEMKKEL